MRLFGPYLTVAHFDSGVVSVLKQMGDANAQQALDVWTLPRFLRCAYVACNVLEAAAEMLLSQPHFRL